MELDNVVTGELDLESMTYDTARITLKGISPSQLESLVSQLRDFCRKPPKKDLPFDNAIRVVQKALSPQKQAELRLQHPDKHNPPGRPVKLDGLYADFCDDIVKLLKRKREMSAGGLRIRIIPASERDSREYAGFYQALRVLRERGIIEITPAQTLRLVVRGESDVRERPSSKANRQDGEAGRRPGQGLD